MYINKSGIIFKINVFIEMRIHYDIVLRFFQKNAYMFSLPWHTLLIDFCLGFLLNNPIDDEFAAHDYKIIQSN